MDANMAHGVFGQIPTEVVEKWAEHLDTADLFSFRLACRQSNAQTLRIVARRFFSTWSTSLTGADLGILEELSRHPDFSSSIKKICIENNNEWNNEWPSNFDPAELSPERRSQAWPRDESGFILTNEIGIANLTTMFKEKRLYPEIIRIRDHCNEPMPRDCYCDPERATYLGRLLIEQGDLAVDSFNVQQIIRSSTEVTVHLLSSKQGSGARYSMLRSVDLYVSNLLSSQWVDQVYLHAPMLEDLRLHSGLPQDRIGSLLSERTPPTNLKRLRINHAQLSGHDILSFFTNSRLTLIDFGFKQVHLIDGSTWRNLLAQIAKTQLNLTAFEIMIVREGRVESDPSDFRNLSVDHVPEECRGGLVLRQKGPPHNRRVTTIRYSGVRAGEVLEAAAASLKL